MKKRLGKCGLSLFMALALACSSMSGGIVHAAEAGAESAENAEESVIQLKDGDFSINVMKKFPQVCDYTVGSGDAAKVFQGNNTLLTSIVVNGENKNVTDVTYTTEGTNKIIYSLVIEGGYQMKAAITASANEYGGDVNLEYLDISQNIKNFKIQKHGLISVSESKGGQAAYDEMYYTNDHFQTVKDVSSRDNAGFTFLYDNSGLAGAIETGLFGQSISLVREAADGDTSVYASGNTYIYRGADDQPTENPWTKVTITSDRNNDGEADWQDAAIAYRGIMDSMPGEQDLSKQSTYVQVLLNYRNKFPRTFEGALDNMKRLANATDGFPQIVEGKNAHEGFDGWPSYGEASVALGGNNALNWFIDTANSDINSFIGTHTNSSEAYAESGHFTTIKDYDNTVAAKDKVITNSPGGWQGMDRETWWLNEENYFKSGLLNQFYDEHAATFPNMKFQYLDIRNGNEPWSGLMTVKEFKEHNWNLFTEYANGSVSHGDVNSALGAKYISWSHNYGSDANSALRRFVMNDKIINGTNSSGDGVLNNLDRVLGVGCSTYLNMFGGHGWHDNGNKDSMEQQTDAFWKQNLPDTFLKNYQILSFKEDVDGNASAEFTDGVKAVYDHSTGLRTISKNGMTVAKVPLIKIQDQAYNYKFPYAYSQNTEIYLPYAQDAAKYEEPGKREDKIYAYVQQGGTKTFDLPSSWHDKYKTVRAYKLDETLGRTSEVSLEVTDNKVTFQFDPNTGYVVYPEEKENTVVNWGDSDGERMMAKDFEFNSMGFNIWQKYGDVPEGIVIEQVQQDTGLAWSSAPSLTGGGNANSSIAQMTSSNRYLKISGAGEKGVSQTLQGLTPGVTYAVCAFVDIQNKPDQKKQAVMIVNSGENTYNASSTAYKISNVSSERLDGWQMIRLFFTAESDSAELLLGATADDGDIRFDDVRTYVQDNPYGKDGYYYNDDFENDHWLGGFMHDAGYNVRPGNGQTLSIESKYAPDFLVYGEGETPLTDEADLAAALEDGITEHSLKLRADSRGVLIKTLPGLVKLEPQTTYTVKVDYKAIYGGAGGWDLDVYSQSANKTLAKAAFTNAQNKIGTLTTSFTTDDSEDYSVRIICSSGSDLIIDNFRIQKINPGDDIRKTNLDAIKGKLAGDAVIAADEGTEVVSVKRGGSINFGEFYGGDLFEVMYKADQPAYAQLIVNDEEKEIIQLQATDGSYAAAGWSGSYNDGDLFQIRMSSNAAFIKAVSIKKQESFFEAENAEMITGKEPSTPPTVYTLNGASGNKAVKWVSVKGNGLSFKGVQESNTIIMQYAAGNSGGGKLGLYVNGSKVQDLSFIQSPGWADYDINQMTVQTISLDSVIPKGANVDLIYELDDTSGAMNIDYIEFKNEGQNPEVPSVKIEGEDFTNPNQDPDAAEPPKVTSPPAASGGKQLEGMGYYGNSVDFTDLPSANQITIHYVNGHNGGKLGGLSLYVVQDGVEGPKQELLFPNTGGWSSYGDLTINLDTDLPEGGTIRLRFDYPTNDPDYGGINVDYLIFRNITEVPETDKVELLELYDTVKDNEQGSYSNDSWMIFENARAFALDVIHDKKADEAAVNLAKLLLDEAIVGLVEDSVDYQELEALYNSYAEKVQSNYTDESWQTFQNALAYANDILMNNGTQEEVEEATAALSNAVQALTRIPAQYFADIINPPIIEKDAVQLIIPSVPEEYSIRITYSDNPGIISLDGRITPADRDISVKLTFTVSEIENADNIGEKAITVMVPAKTKPLVKFDTEDLKKAVRSAENFRNSGIVSKLTKDQRDLFEKVYNDAKDILEKAEAGSDKITQKDIIRAKDTLNNVILQFTPNKDPVKTRLTAPAVKKTESNYRYVKITFGKVKGAKSYEIYRKTGKKKAVKIATVTGNYYKDTKASAKIKMTYYVKAIAKNPELNLNSKLGKSKSITLPQSAKLKSAKQIKRGQIQLKWKKVSGASQYVVLRSTKKTGTYSKVAVLKGSSATSYTDKKKLKKGKTYYYKIVVMKSKLYSPAGNTKSVKNK